MKIDTETILNILTPNNKALSKMVNDGALKAYDPSYPTFNLQSVLDELFDGLVSGEKSTSQIESLLKNTQFFKSLGVLADNLKSLNNLLQNDYVTHPKLSHLEALASQIDGLDEKKLKEFFSNSGVFFESKLLQNKANIHDDLKAILLSLQQESKNEAVIKEAEKLLIQIDYYQLLSLASDANWIYLPLNWEEFDNGKIGFKVKPDKSVYCEIDLMLKKYEQLKVKLFMQDGEYLNIVFETNNESFLNDAKPFLSNLKQVLNKIGFITSIDFKNSDDALAKKFEVGDYFEGGISINA